MKRVLQDLPFLIVRQLLLSRLNLFMSSLCFFPLFYCRALVWMWGTISLATDYACLSSPFSTLGLPGTDIKWSKPMGKSHKSCVGILQVLDITLTEQCLSQCRKAFALELITFPISVGHLSILPEIHPAWLKFWERKVSYVACPSPQL